MLLFVLWSHAVEDLRKNRRAAYKMEHGFTDQKLHGRAKGRMTGYARMHTCERMQYAYVVSEVLHERQHVKAGSNSVSAVPATEKYPNAKNRGGESNRMSTGSRQDAPVSENNIPD